MAKKRHHSSSVNIGKYEGNYEGLNNARNMERSDSMMISEDKSAIANLPQSVMYKPWPKSHKYHDYGLDDTIKGIDEQQNADNSGLERHMSKKKY